METLKAYGQKAADDLHCEIEELKAEKEQTIRQLCNIQLKINSREARLKALLSDLAANTPGTTNGPGNCNAAQAEGRGPVFHEQNDAVDSH